MMPIPIQILLGVLLFPVLLLSQEYSPEEAEERIQLLKSGSSLTEEEKIREGRILLNYFMERNDSCLISEVGSALASPYENVGKIDSALFILLSTEEFARCCSWASYGEHIMIQAGAYIELEDFEKVEELFIDLRDNYQGLVPDSVLNNFKTNYAIALVYMGRIEESEKMFRETFHFHRQSNDTTGQIDALNNLGALSGMMGELDSSAFYLEQAAVLCALSNCSDQLEILQNLSTLSGELGDHEKAEFYIDSALNMAIRHGNLYAMTDLYREIAITYQNQERYEEAIYALIDHSDWKDSLFNQQRAEASAEFQEIFESEKRQRQIQELELEKLDGELREGKLKRSRNLYLFSGLGVLVLSLGLWSRLRYISRTRSIIQEEKERSDNLLLNILPREVADELKNKGKSKARDFDMVSILFTDFVEFTSTSEKMSAAELVDEVDHCFRAFDAIMEKYGIEKIKTIGDAYMAAGGLHIPRTTEPKDVVLAALEMQDFILSRMKENSAQGKLAFEMRAGVHTGPVVAGIVGVKKFQYDIWGDTVNTASRMESHGSAGRLNISNDTYVLVKDDPRFVFENRGTTEVKGKGMMDMWFVSIKS
jgi:class 3 adenylate cyclase